MLQLQTKMRKSLLFLLLLLTCNSYSQVQPGYYMGLERMCWKNEKGRLVCYDSPRKWYHENYLWIEQDSVFIFKAPIQIRHKDTLYSSSDGAFYYYVGKIFSSDKGYYTSIVLTTCDYCAQEVRLDTLLNSYITVDPDTITYQITVGKNELIINNVRYKLSPEQKAPFKRKNFNYYFKYHGPDTIKIQ